MAIKTIFEKEATMQDSISTPLLSIVTVVRNDEAGLSRTKLSILSQSFENWEWIVVDGLSSDRTLDAVRDLSSDSRVRVMSEADKGLYDAMNKGSLLAKGNYLNMLNAGDIYSGPNAISGCIDVLTKGTADILFTSRISVFGAGDIVRIPVKTDLSRIYHSLPTSHQACFIRTDVQRNFPYNLDYKVSADFDCIARIAFSGARLEFLDHATIVSDQGRFSTSFRHPFIGMRECIRTQREILGLSRYSVSLSIARRLPPMIFRRVAAFIPGLMFIPRFLGKASSIEMNRHSD